jgi:hypothetical protein
VKYQEHTPSPFCFCVKCFNGGIYSKDPVTYFASLDGDDVAKAFFGSMI